MFTSGLVQMYTSGLAPTQTAQATAGEGLEMFTSGLAAEGSSAEAGDAVEMFTSGLVQMFTSGLAPRGEARAEAGEGAELFTSGL